ncbi:FkbM family methyltransferase [Novosphingobium sp. AP12]|uniref:FkbM family methyltransferase n=1 Tax=Novosphingobium sp. AP12 TaxID=1144305 RepID=UPI0002DFBA04|nr:FkbM family methyltransferase [Novosphingobium sp. AP12]
MRLFELPMLARSRRVANESAIRAACKVAYLGNNAALCRVLGRYKAYVDTTDIGLSSHLMLDGYWEMWVTETLASLIRPGMVVADIGANIGYFTLLMAELVGPAGRVHAFEPNPRLVELLNKSLMVNGFARWASVHQTALGDKGDHSVTLVVPPNTPMNAYILPPGAEAPPEGVEVPVARLDSRQDWQDIELAKIDVEGAEELIWAGAQGLLDSGKLRTVVIEFNPHRYGDPGAFLERLSAHGFALNHLTLDAGVVPTDMDYILSRSGPEDIMLVLKR